MAASGGEVTNRVLAFSAFALSLLSLVIVSHDKIYTPSEGVSLNFQRAKRDAGDRVECVGDELDQVELSDDDVEERLRRVACGMRQLNSNMQRTNEDLTNALFYTNELSGKLAKTEEAVEINGKLLENYLQYLEDAAADSDEVTTAAAPVPTPAPSPVPQVPQVDVTALRRSVSDLNRTLNAWVARSVMAYESQGRLSALAGAERRSMLERVSRLESDLIVIGPRLGEIANAVVAAGAEIDAVRGMVTSVNDTLTMIPAATTVQPPPTTTTTPATTTSVATTTTSLAPPAGGGGGEMSAASAEKLGELEKSIGKNLLLINGVRSSIDDIHDQFTKHASDDWYNAPNGYQYYLSVNAFNSDSYARSRRFCQYRGGDLAHVGMRNEAVYRFLWNTILSRSRLLCVWIGLTDVEAEGDWKWIDGKKEEDGWSNWSRTYTGRSSPLKDCASIRSGMWHPSTCSGVRQEVCSFMCERKIFQ